jgi:hypothetical protein
MKRKRGVVAVLAMLFLMLMVTLSLAMVSLSTSNLQSASNLGDAERARATAESGLSWQAFRFLRMARPKSTAGKIDLDVATALWPALKTSIQNDFKTLSNTSEQTLTDNGSSLISNAISDGSTGGTFTIHIDQPAVDASDPMAEPYLLVHSTGQYGEATRTVSMRFSMSKKIKYAVVGKVPIQLGRNTEIEGPIGMGTAAKYPPILTLSDFRHLTTSLKNKIDAFNDYMQGTTTVNGVKVANHAGYDNRINVNDTWEYTRAQNAGYRDVNGDKYIDEYDLFVKEFDKDGDHAISKSEFTNPSNGKLYDQNLFDAMDSTGAPMFAGDITREGYQDGVIDNYDAYAKVSGSVTMATTASAWQSNLGSGTQINDVMTGPIVPDNGEQAVKFGVTSSDMFDLSPSNFEECVANYRAKTGSAAGTTKKTSTVIENATIGATDANGGTVTEKTPYGTTTYQATYKRPVFKNMTFKNCIIAKGTNALFDNCTFQGVTFVDMTHDITTSATHSGGTVVTDKDSGMTWSQRMKKVSGSTPSFSKDTTLASTNSYGFADGNNVRFNNCTFNGPLAGTDATAYTHFTNSWEFTGSTMFDNQADDTATIVCPNTNIEMGSFTDPAKAPSKLVGVVVAGNLDVRGTSIVDGSIIVTGDGAGNTTLGYFGPSDGDTDPSAMPEGGYGRLNIRYNPYRALPSGINIAVDVLPTSGTYSEKM